jgi:hypothetical protein
VFLMASVSFKALGERVLVVGVTGNEGNFGALVPKLLSFGSPSLPLPVFVVVLGPSYLSL